MIKDCKQHSQTFKVALRGKKLKATPGRIAVLDIFAHHSKPLSIKEIKSIVGKQGVDVATLYRNTESLTKEGLLVKVNLNGKNASYELASRKHHHHLICQKCGLINDVKIISRPDLNKQALGRAKDFSKVTAHSLEFFGICKKCEKKIKLVKLTAVSLTSKRIL